MATIDIKRSHKLDKTDAKTKAEEVAKNLETKIGIEWKWEGDTIRFDTPKGAAKGVKGELRVSDNDVHVLVDLPFLLRAIKGTVEDKINEKLAGFS
ncbi:MAG: polyhydroxyalkanoic acid system family protein [Polyangiaceae bacterium]